MVRFPSIVSVLLSKSTTIRPFSQRHIVTALSSRFPLSSCCCSLSVRHCNATTQAIPDLYNPAGTSAGLSVSLSRYNTSGISANSFSPLDAGASVPVSTAHLLHCRESSASVLNRSTPSVHTGNSWDMPHPLWTADYVNHIQDTHKEPKDWMDRLALNTIKLMKFNFDLMSGYKFGKPTETKVLNRIMFLESVAGVPGSVAGILRHLSSLRRMKRDNGWIHTLFEEAENERMHLLTATALKQPGPLFRGAVFMTQGVFFNFFFVAYLISPRFCHRLVGYLEEQATATYTQILDDWDAGFFPNFAKTPAPDIAKKYWRMKDDAMLRDVILLIRADETHHRDVNHTFGDLKSSDLNPFMPGR